MRKNKNKFNLSKIYRLLSVLAGLIVITLVILELTNTTHLFHKQAVPPVIPAHTNNGAPINDNSNSPGQKPSNGSSAPTSGNPLPADVTQHTLVTPSGDFVSNHFPGQNGTPTTEASVCNTSPGATCYIKFTNVATAETTQLTPQVADARGTVTWYWDVSDDAHLTSGQWKITAIATLGDQTKSASDTLNLTIK